ncbi:MAG: methylated-DNA--[protein]-cysteine S-methyltransferase [Clostridium sp.]|nr:methylated-DNA--[protein]-cysteine S-methyltransferase [Clostridium sp.]MCM1399840.1 methylated-DNA--[protein]-cysteine S-methyltransferase [Clostridium sp.]MCM1460675.1 methylated-DNA--[protein]-cysteine S-methyltransferase [Bacteroides sp.]
MNKVLNDDLIYLVFSIVEEIPEGTVATYGQIASLAGKPKNSRLIGKILSLSEFYGQYPCHRVVNCNGRIAPYFTEQKKLLEHEGISFKNETCVDIQKYKWKV